jgi:6-pyruvoyltetrahydropterin/6-carboxytetrahydropterin synthase
LSDSLYYVAASPFESARMVEILPQGHRSRNLHGHSFLAKLRVDLPENWAPFPGGEVDSLSEKLTTCVEPLNYDLLNNHMEIPTDENLARWIRDNLDVPGIKTVGVQSTREQGADLNEDNHAHIWRRFRFEAAHQLPNVPEGHQCGRMHGHGFEVILHANQDLGSRDMGVDFDHLQECWLPVHRELHRSCLNEIVGLENPTSEMLSEWIWSRLKDVIPDLSWVTVYETATAGCHYDGLDYRIWKEQAFEGALTHKRAPKGDSRGNLLGHSYLTRLHLTAPLDEVMGWTVDYGDVKEIFKPVYKQLDHHRLDELDGISDGDSGTVVKWMKTHMADRLPELDRIDLYENSGCGVLLSWGNRVPILPI